MVVEHREHPFVQLARRTIETYVREGRVLRSEEAPRPVAGDPAGVFVTIHTHSTHDLRGCVGTITPTKPTLAQEIISNAISAAVHDRRFEPIAAGELDDLALEVSVLHPAERISSVTQLDPRRYGVIVQNGWRRGLLLPDIPGVDDPEMQVDIARQKAWIGPDERLDLWRFQVDKYE